jgi:hypothetical protein
MVILTNKAIRDQLLLTLCAIFTICSRVVHSLLSRVSTRMSVDFQMGVPSAVNIILLTCITIQWVLGSGLVIPSRVCDARDDSGRVYPVCGPRLSTFQHEGCYAGGRPFVPASPVTLCKETWRVELVGDINSVFTMNGISNGFSLVDSKETPSSFVCKNYKSSSIENRTLLEEQIVKEIDEA